MPIDYDLLRKQSQQRVNDMLAGRPQGIEDELNQARQNIQGGRNQNLDALSGTVGSIGQGYNLGNIPTNTGLIQRNLNSNLNTNLANQKFNLNSQNMGNRLNQGNAMVGNSQDILNQNKNYASATMNQNVQQAQEAKLSQMQRDQAWKQAQMQQNYADQGVALQNQYLYPQMDYQSSIMRLLTGLPVQIGTSMLMNNYMNPQANIPYTGNISQTNPGYGMNTNTTFTTGIDPMTGQRTSNYGQNRPLFSGGY